MDVADALTKLLALAQAVGSAAAILPMTTRPGRAPDEETRQRILEAIRKAPGVHGRLLRDMLDLGGGELDGHVKHLIDAGLVETATVANRVVLYPAGKVPPPNLLVLEIPTVRRIAQIILKKPGATSGEVAEALGVSKRRAQMALTDLCDAGLATSTREALRVRYSPTAKLRTALSAQK